METILWLLSWIYINFPLCHLNKARIPVGIKIFAAPSFYDREKSRREVAPQRFHFQSKSVSHAEVAPLCFYFWIHFPFSCYRRGQRSRHVLFSPLKRQEHARIAGIRPTQHRHLSPVLFLICGNFLDIGVLVLPVATLFTITQLWASMPGAPVGFGTSSSFTSVQLFIQ